MKRPPPFDPYTVLGVAPAATDAELAAARKVLSARHHPDRDRTPGAAARFVEIQQAYALLADPARRRAYDEHVQQPRRERAAQAERAQQEQAEAAERARREQQERAQAGEDLAERTRRAEAQRERARRDQEERAAQMRRILERARLDPGPTGSAAPHDVYELQDPPGRQATRSGRGRSAAVADEGHGEWNVSDDGTEPAAVPPGSAPGASADAKLAEELALLASAGLAAVGAVGAGLWIAGSAAVAAGAGFLVRGTFWLALLGAAAAVPFLFALFGIVILGLTYPLAALTLAATRIVRTPSGPAAARDRERTIRLLANYGLQMAVCLGAGGMIAWLALTVAPGQPQARREPLELICAVVGPCVALAGGWLTISLIFGLLYGRDSLWSGVSRPAAPPGERAGADRPGPRGETRQRARRGSRQGLHVPT